MSKFYFRIKPSPTSDVVDIIGRKLMNKNVKIFFTSNTTLFVNWRQGGVTEFDQDGFMHRHE